MIPVVTMDKEGNVYHQVFNDNLTVTEQINRILLGTIFYAQQELVNDEYSVMHKIGKAAYDDAKLAEIKTAAETLDKAIKTAVATFEGNL